MIGDRIKALREERGYKLTEFAEMIGVKKQTLYKYEKNLVTNIPLDKIVRMAVLLDVTPGYLAGWDSEDRLKDNFTQLFNELCKLNKDGMQKVFGYIEDLIDSGKYKKD